jgi:hypothetical protein
MTCLRGELFLGKNRHYLYASISEVIVSSVRSSFSVDQ